MDRQPVMRSALLVAAAIAGAGFILELALMLGNPPEPVADNPRSGWTLAWLLWLLATLVAFAVIEGIALFNDHGGDTLTEHIQWIAGKSPVWTGVVGVGIAAFFGWFMSHLFGRDSRVWEYLSRQAPDLDEGPVETEDGEEPSPDV